MDIYFFNDYKAYLKSVLPTLGDHRGLRSNLAKNLGCQTGFISQVLNGNTHFSLEHSLKICSFLKLNKDESHFFMLLIQLGKAGSKELVDYYSDQINEIVNHRMEIKSRINIKSTLSEEHHLIYYGQWYYAAIHIATSLLKPQTLNSLSEKLNLPTTLTKEILEFLIQTGLVVSMKDGSYKISNKRIHLDRESPLISKHHMNWRLESMKSLEKNNKEDLHYSSILTMSLVDFQKVKKILLQVIKDIEPILETSPEEEIYSLCFDFFSLGK